MIRHRLGRLAAIAWCAMCASWLSAAPPAPADLNTVMTLVAQRIVDYYRRAERVICLEESTVQPIDRNWGSEGFARTVESELRVEFEAVDGDALPEASIIRDVRRINGRAPRERDKKDRSGCTDPNPLSPEPLAFLLPSHRDEYRFTKMRDARENERAALIVEFTTANRTSKPVLIEDERGHDDCFDWSGPVATNGRVWIDATTYDVLRVYEVEDETADSPLDHVQDAESRFGSYRLLAASGKFRFLHPTRVQGD